MVWNPQHLLCFDFQPNKSVDQSYKMPTSRCVRLMLISMANDLKEVWISDHPVLLGAYLWQYMPTWALWLTSRLGKKRIQNFKNGLVRAIYIFLHNYAWILCENPVFNFLKMFYFSDPYQSYDENNKNLGYCSVYPILHSISNGLPYDS